MLVLIANPKPYITSIIRHSNTSNVSLNLCRTLRATSTGIIQIHRMLVLIRTFFLRSVEKPQIQIHRMLVLILLNFLLLHYHHQNSNTSNVSLNRHQQYVKPNAKRIQIHRMLVLISTQ